MVAKRGDELALERPQGEPNQAAGHLVLYLQPFDEGEFAVERVRATSLKCAQVLEPGEVGAGVQQSVNDQTSLRGRELRLKPRNLGLY